MLRYSASFIACRLRYAGICPRFLQSPASFAYTDICRRKCISKPAAHLGTIHSRQSMVDFSEVFAPRAIGRHKILADMRRCYNFRPFLLLASPALVMFHKGKGFHLPPFLEAICTIRGGATLNRNLLTANAAMSVPICTVAPLVYAHLSTHSSRPFQLFVIIPAGRFSPRFCLARQ